MSEIDDLDAELTAKGIPPGHIASWRRPGEHMPDYPERPAGGGPDSPPPERKIPEILLHEAVQWALNRPKPEDPGEQEAVFGILFWYLPEERLYLEARERWGMGAADIQAIVSRPTFYDQLGNGARLLMIKTYTRIMLAMSDRAERGNLGAAQFVLEEMGMKREHLVGQQNSENLEKLVGKLILAVQDVLPKTDLAAIGAVTTPGFVPNAVLPKAFHQLPEFQRRKVITKSGTYQRRRRK